MIVLADIKSLLGLTDSSKDTLLRNLVEIATNDAKNLTHQDDVDDVVPRMVCYLYNAVGNEGINQESYNGVTFQYSGAYPEDIMAIIRTKRVLRLC